MKIDRSFMDASWLTKYLVALKLCIVGGWGNIITTDYVSGNAFVLIWTGFCNLTESILRFVARVLILLLSPLVALVVMRLAKKMYYRDLEARRKMNLDL